MKLQTHIAFGLLFGIIFYYFFNLDLSFAILVGFFAFIPDIDWRMQVTWKLGEKLNIGRIHRTVLHNIWAMLLIAIIFFLLTKNLIIVLGIIVGFISHLFADSLTIEGIYWLWPYGDKFGKEGKFFKNGNFKTGSTSEKIIQIVILAVSGFLFLIKSQGIGNIFSFNGLITIVIFIFAGFILMKSSMDMIKKFIRKLGL